MHTCTHTHSNHNSPHTLISCFIQCAQFQLKWCCKPHARLQTGQQTMSTPLTIWHLDEAPINSDLYNTKSQLVTCKHSRKVKNIWCTRKWSLHLASSTLGSTSAWNIYIHAHSTFVYLSMRSGRTISGLSKAKLCRAIAGSRLKTLLNIAILVAGSRQQTNSSTSFSVRRASFKVKWYHLWPLSRSLDVKNVRSVSSEAHIKLIILNVHTFY